MKNNLTDNQKASAGGARDDRKNGCLSVVVPVYNTGEYLRACLDSICAQTYRNLEIILVDDGSTDGSGKVCDDYAARDARVRVLHQENRGCKIAKEMGIRAATGEYITFVDSDDWLDPNMYASMLPHMREAQSVSCGVVSEFGDSKTKEAVGPFAPGLYEGKDYDYILRNYFICNGEVVTVFPSQYNKVFLTEPMRAGVDNLQYEAKQADELMLVYQYMLGAKSTYVVHDCYYHKREVAGSISKAQQEQSIIDYCHIYRAFCTMLGRYEAGEALLKPVQQYFVHQVFYLLITHMGFPSDCWPIQHILDTSELRGKRLILFGAGNVGMDYWRQLHYYGFPVVKWVASRASVKLGETVELVDTIRELDYDLVVIAISKRKTADEMKAQLLALGVPEEKIVWRMPMPTVA